MIARIWHGWTSPENADEYEQLLREKILPEIAAKKVSGYKGIELLRRSLTGEAGFITIMYFESWEAVKEFAGKDYQQAYVPSEAQQLLERYDDQARHYEIKARLEY